MGEVKYWGIESIDDNTRLQAEKMARSPIVSGHLALIAGRSCRSRSDYR